MKDKLIDYLVCPICHQDLNCESTQLASDLPWSEIIEGRLVCLHCNREYPIKNGIPRLLIEQPVKSETKKTVDGFGYEWSRFNNQILDTYMSQQENFYDFIYPIKKDFFKGKIVLDAGCGMGRFLKLGAKFESQEIIGIDLSQSVEAAYQNTRRLPNAHVIQADLMALPLKNGFDYIFSVGVLQFLSAPRTGFLHLVNLLKPGGRLSIWVYSEENNRGIVRFISPIRKNITSRLPHSVLYFISLVLGGLLFAGIHLVYKPANEWKYLKRIGPALPKNDYLYYSSRLSIPELASVIFDHLVPQQVVYLSKAEIMDWFKKAQLKDIDITSRNNMSWRAHGTL